MLEVFSHFAECSLAPSEPLVHATQEGQNGAFGTSDTRNVEEIEKSSKNLIVYEEAWSK